MKIINGEPKFTKEDIYNLSCAIKDAILHTPFSRERQLKIYEDLEKEFTKLMQSQQKSITELIVHHYQKGVIGLSVDEIDRLQEFRYQTDLMDEVQKNEYAAMKQLIKHHDN